MQFEKKIDRVYFDEVVAGRKTFELRHFEPSEAVPGVGDSILLRVFDRSTKTYGGESVLVIVTYRLDDYGPVKLAQNGWVVLGIKPPAAAREALAFIKKPS